MNMSLQLRAPSPPPLPETLQTAGSLHRNSSFAFSARRFLPTHIHRQSTTAHSSSILQLRGGITSSPLTITAVISESKQSLVSDTKTIDDSAPPIKIMAIVGEGTVSPLKSTPWEEVMRHTAKRLRWIEEGYQLLVFTDGVCRSNDQGALNMQRELQYVDILVIISVTEAESAKWIKNNSKKVQNIVSFDSSPDLENKLGGTYIQSGNKGSFLSKLVGFSSWDKTKESRELIDTVCEAWDRHNSDDIRFCLLVLINAYVRPVPILRNLRAKGFSTLSRMVKNCGPQILNCLLDPNCRKALQCLNQCSPVDQVCNYRCIASYESANLEAFSLCVLQKNNCLDLEAKIPEKPYVPPMTTFRGKELCHEATEDLFIGWLGNLNWSWRVVAGQNPAYDQFPCQYQLFYRGKAKGSFWYEPVFQVKTLDGELVWRRRRYRVKRGKVPGTFYFSVLDNGVVSNEFWTIVDVADDLGWGLFHYSGAARVAGQSYTGAVLVSPDGGYPHTQRESVNAALENCGIKEWELYTVDSSCCIDPPLGIPEGSSLQAQIETKVPNEIST